jgi:hypothetical protein
MPFNMPSCAVILEPSMGLGTDRNRVLVPAQQSRNLKSRYGARNRFQEPGLELSKLHRLAGRYDNPMLTWFLAPISGTKVTDTGYIGWQNRFLGTDCLLLYTEEEKS